MRGPLAAGLIALMASVTPSAAHACTIAVNNEVLDDPDERGISAREKSRREAAMRTSLARENRERMRRLETEARRGLANEADTLALSLVESMVPAPVDISLGLCAAGFTVRSTDFDAAMAAWQAAAGESGSHRAQIFEDQYASQARGCAAEMRALLAGYLVAHVAQEKVARVWFEVHRLGYDRSGLEGAAPLYFHPAGSPTRLTLWHGAPVNGQDWFSQTHRLGKEAGEKLSERNWARMSRFLTDDGDAREVVAVLERGLVELGDEAVAYRGMCPQTARALEAFVAEAIEQAKPLKPRVEILFDVPAPVS